MTLRAFLTLFLKRKEFFLSIVLGALLLALGWYGAQPASFRVSLFLSVTREGKSATPEYQYDEFYRLEADERFSDSLVQYLKTPQALAAIETNAHLAPSDGNFVGSFGLKPVRLSSNLISLSTRTLSVSGGKALAPAIERSVNGYIQSLNAQAQEPDWFTVIASEPVFAEARLSFSLVLLGGLLVGIFVGFWAILLEHFWKRGKEQKDGHEDWN